MFSCVHNLLSRHYAQGVVNPSTLLQDEEQTFEVPEGEEKTYNPLNYSRKFKGTVSLRDCLVESLNVPTVKVGEMVGIDKVITMAHKLGITSPLPNALSLALGSCETTPLEMCVAYSTIAAATSSLTTSNLRASFSLPL